MRATVGRMLVGFFFATLLVLGLWVVGDYGLSWDEETSRLGNGLPNYLYLTTGDRSPLKACGEKYHGPAFEIVLFFLEKGLGLEDTREVYLLRHRVTFLVFAASAWVFYRVLRRRFRDRLIGLAGAALLVLGPRTFADAFYNSKDATFLAAYVFALATLGRFLRGPTRGAAALHALACGFLIDVRIQGIIVPALTFGFVLLRYRVWRPPGEASGIPWRSLGWYCGLTFCFVTLFWPYLWHNPPGLFLRAYREMSSYPWPGTVLYRGHEVLASRLPWHYAPTWILLTTPLPQLGLAAVGTVVLLVRLARRLAGALPGGSALLVEDVTWLAALVAPLAAVVLLRSTLYDGWRHLYFLYPPLVYLAVLGLVALLERAGAAGSWAAPARIGIHAGFGLCLVAVASVMVRDHPYQNVYFNALAGRDLQAIKQRYETDYWGLSCRAGLERLLALDPSPVLTLWAETDPARDAALMLAPDERARLRFTERPEEAEYLASHFRRHRGEFPPGEEVCAVRVGNARLFVVQRLRPKLGPS